MGDAPDLIDIVAGALLMQQFSDEPVTREDALDWFEDQRGDVKDNLRRKAREIIGLIDHHRLVWS